MRTSTCWILMFLTVNRSQNSHLRRVTKTQTQTSHMATSHTTEIHCMEKTDCPQTAPNSHLSNIKTMPSVLMQTLEAHTSSRRSGPSLKPQCLWMSACSRNTLPVCCRPPGLPLLRIHQIWVSLKHTGNRNHQLPRSENGWMEFSMAPLSSSPGQRRCGKA